MFPRIRSFMFFLLMAGPCCALAPKMAMPVQKSGFFKTALSVFKPGIQRYKSWYTVRPKTTLATTALLAAGAYALADYYYFRLGKSACIAARDAIYERADKKLKSGDEDGALYWSGFAAKVWNAEWCDCDGWAEYTIGKIYYGRADKKQKQNQEYQQDLASAIEWLEKAVLKNSLDAGQMLANPTRFNLLQYHYDMLRERYNVSQIERWYCHLQTQRQPWTRFNSIEEYFNTFPHS